MNGEYDDEEELRPLGREHWQSHCGKTARRQDAGLTQEQVAEQLKIGNEAVSRMERGLVMPTVAHLLELASLFHCDASALLVESSNRPPEQAQHLAQMLARLDSADREMVLAMVEQLTNRLAKPS